MFWKKWIGYIDENIDLLYIVVHAMHNFSSHPIIPVLLLILTFHIYKIDNWIKAFFEYVQSTGMVYCCQSMLMQNKN